ncbi:uncharacterized protein LOC113352662 [Papaver somniferum]|uniref:uncharacterized protein LOC113352662 n=1 Tax=Papaver somniferum TaxID=3469 RepID=UPI000E6F7913|nr:uncharacterized protein LOC113352662 [Papaver somniferum]
MESSPWVSRDDLLALERRVPNKLPQEYRFDKVEFWAQLHGLRVNYLNRKFIQSLVSYVGSHITIYVQEARNWGKFDRVRIPVDVKRPLRDSITFPLSNGQEIVAEIRYERLPRFCLFCGLLGHLMSLCPKVHQLKDKVYHDFPPELHQQAYNLILPKYQRSINASLKNFNIDLDEFKDSDLQEEIMMELVQNQSTILTEISGMMNHQANSSATRNLSSTSSPDPYIYREDNIHRKLRVSGVFSDKNTLS